MAADGSETGEIQAPAFKEQQEMMEMDEEMRHSEEILNLRMKPSMKLKQNIGEFVDENPQIPAKLVQNWLLGKGDTNGRNGRK